MKLELFALVLFLVSVVLVFFLAIEKKTSIEEEVFPSPYLFQKTPYANVIKDRINEINRQLLFLEYDVRIPQKNLNSKELENIIFSINDPRAKKIAVKRIWKYWWGYGVEEITFKIKHIEIRWYPKIHFSKAAQITFGEALYKALNGEESYFYPGKADKDIIKNISEKYKVLIYY